MTYPAPKRARTNKPTPRFIPVGTQPILGIPSAQSLNPVAPPSLLSFTRATAAPNAVVLRSPLKPSFKLTKQPAKPVLFPRNAGQGDVRRYDADKTQAARSAAALSAYRPDTSPSSVAPSRFSPTLISSVPVRKSMVKPGLAASLGYGAPSLNLLTKVRPGLPAVALDTAVPPIGDAAKRKAASAKIIRQHHLSSATSPNAPTLRANELHLDTGNPKYAVPLPNGGYRPATNDEIDEYEGWEASQTPFGKRTNFQHIRVAQDTIQNLYYSPLLFSLDLVSRAPDIAQVPFHDELSPEYQRGMQSLYELGQGAPFAPLLTSLAKGLSATYYMADPSRIRGLKNDESGRFATTEALRPDIEKAQPNTFAADWWEEFLRNPEITLTRDGIPFLSELLHGKIGASVPRAMREGMTELGPRGVGEALRKSSRPLRLGERVTDPYWSQERAKSFRLTDPATTGVSLSDLVGYGTQSLWPRIPRRRTGTPVLGAPPEKPATHSSPSTSTNKTILRLPERVGTTGRPPYDVPRRPIKPYLQPVLRDRSTPPLVPLRTESMQASSAKAFKDVSISPSRVNTSGMAHDSLIPHTPLSALADLARQEPPIVPPSWGNVSYFDFTEYGKTNPSLVVDAFNNTFGAPYGEIGAILLESFARGWAKKQGKTPTDYYDTHFRGVTQGGSELMKIVGGDGTEQALTMDANLLAEYLQEVSQEVIGEKTQNSLWAVVAAGDKPSFAAPPHEVGHVILDDLPEDIQNRFLRSVGEPRRADGKITNRAHERFATALEDNLLRGGNQILNPSLNSLYDRYQQYNRENARMFKGVNIPRRDAKRGRVSWNDGTRIEPTQPFSPDFLWLLRSRFGDVSDLMEKGIAQSERDQ